VRAYVERVRAAGPEVAALDIADTAQLIRQLDDLQARVQKTMASAHGWLGRRRARHAVRRDVDDRLFPIGVVIANSGRPVLFNLSYALGATGMALT